MRIKLGNIIILVFPFFMMVCINEIIRPAINDKSSARFGAIAINSSVAKEDRCTWYCHDHTKYCKEHHVKFNKRYFAMTDQVYFGVISLLRSGGNYELANIFILVIVIPLAIWYLIIKSLNIQYEINKLKKRENEFNS